MGQPLRKIDETEADQIHGDAAHRRRRIAHLLALGAVRAARRRLEIQQDEPTTPPAGPALSGASISADAGGACISATEISNKHRPLPSGA